MRAWYRERGARAVRVRCACMGRARSAQGVAQHALSMARAELLVTGERTTHSQLLSVVASQPDDGASVRAQLERFEKPASESRA